MLDVLSFCFGPIGIIVILILAYSVKIIAEYQRGVLFTLGKYSGILNPGLNIIVPVIQWAKIIDMRITTIDIPKQGVMTKDNVPVYVNAVIYMRVEDPEKAVLKIKDYKYAVSQYGQTALRDVIGNKTLDEILTDREGVAEEIKKIVDTETAEWGVDITAIKIQDINLPENMKRAMARQAEAEREKRGVIIKSEGEVTAANNLAKAAKILSSTPGALHLRTLQTISDVSGDPSAKFVFFLPVEVLEAFESVKTFLINKSSTKEKSNKEKK